MLVAIVALAAIAVVVMGDDGDKREPFTSDGHSGPSVMPRQDPPGRAMREPERAKVRDAARRFGELYAPFTYGIDTTANLRAMRELVEPDLYRALSSTPPPRPYGTEQLAAPRVVKVDVDAEQRIVDERPILASLEVVRGGEATTLSVLLDPRSLRVVELPGTPLVQPT